MRESRSIVESRYPGRITVDVVLLSVALGIGLAISPAASAAPILFSFSGDGVGTLDQTPFGGHFAIEVLADTDDVSIFGAAASDIFFVDGPATIDLPLGAGSFSNPARITSTQPVLPLPGGAAIGLGVPGDLLSIADPAIVGYQLDGAFGPVASTTPALLIGDIQLDIGLLRFTSISDITFLATPIPEPSTALLVTVGMLAVLSLGRR